MCLGQFHIYAWPISFHSGFLEQMIYSDNAFLVFVFPTSRLVLAVPLIEINVSISFIKVQMLLGDESHVHCGSRCIYFVLQLADLSKQLPK